MQPSKPKMEQGSHVMIGKKLIAISAFAWPRRLRHLPAAKKRSMRFRKQSADMSRWLPVTAQR